MEEKTNLYLLGGLAAVLTLFTYPLIIWLVSVAMLKALDNPIAGFFFGVAIYKGGQGLWEYLKFEHNWNTYLLITNAVLFMLLVAGLILSVQ